MAEWLAAGTKAGELSPVASARLSGAISVALGHGYYVYTDRIEEKWLAPLADVVLAIARSNERDLSPASQITGHWRFQATDECRRARRELTKILATEIDKLAPERINYLIGWIMPNDPAVPEETWQAIAKALEARWAAEKDPEIRNQLSAPLTQVLSHVGTNELLVFLRRQLAEGPEQYRAAYALQLFNTLLSQLWSAPIEDEAFTLLERLSDAEEPADRLFAQVSALYRLTDAMVNARNQAGLAQIEDIEQLKRLDRREKTEEQLRLAREGFADRLKQEMPRHQGALVQWLNIERLYLDAAPRNASRRSRRRMLENIAHACGFATRQTRGR